MEGVGLAHLYPALAWSVCAPGHHGYPRTWSHSEKGPERPLGSPDHGYDGETVSPFPQSSSQTSAGIFSSCYACFVAACLHQHGPGDPRQLIGKGSSQHVVMQRFATQIATHRRGGPLPERYKRRNGPRVGATGVTLGLDTLWGRSRPANLGWTYQAALTSIFFAGF